MDKLLETVYKAMDERQADNIEIIDFRGVSPYVDYFVIGTARNDRMSRSILDEVEDKAAEIGVNKISVDSGDNLKWRLLDLGSVVCHVFYDGERENYDLEGLWKDLPRIRM